MYRCPFKIENANGEITEQTSFLISRGQDQKTGIVYRQDNPEADIVVDAIISDLVKVSLLKKMIRAGLLSTEGRKYLTYNADSISDLDRIWNRYLKSLRSGTGKSEYS